MQTYIKELPYNEREQAIKEIQDGVKGGTLDILTPYKNLASRRSHEKLMGSLTASVTGGGIAFLFLLGATGALLPAAIISGLFGAGGIKLSLDKRKQDIERIQDNELGEVLTDQELIEMAGLTKSFGAPATPAIAKKLAVAKKIVATELEEVSADGTLTIDVEAKKVSPSEVKIENQPSPSSEPTVTKAPVFILDGKEAPLLQDGKPNPRLLEMTMKDRASIIIECLQVSGSNLQKYINRPLFCAGGMPGTAKTTLLTLICILDKALNDRKIFYCTSDDDVPPFAFDAIATGSPENAEKGFMKYAEAVEAAGMGDLKDQTWLLDEFAKVVAEFEEDKRRKLWLTTLTGIQKRRGRVRAVLHGKTGQSCGVPKGYTEQFKQNVVLSCGEKTENQDGTETPTGEYKILRSTDGESFSDTGEQVFIPSWLKFNTGGRYEGMPCPIRSLLCFFPELDLRKDGKTPESLVKEPEKNENITPSFPTIPPIQTDDSADVFSIQERKIEPVITPVFAAPLPVIPAPVQKVDKSPIVKGTDYTVNQLLKKIAKKARDKKGEPLSESDFVNNGLHSSQRVGARAVMPKLFKALATHYADSYYVKPDETGKLELFHSEVACAQEQVK